MSIWWFFILILVGGVVAMGITAFYSADQDVRQVEARILADKIIYCINEQGNLNLNVLDLNFNVYKECKLSESLFGEGSNFFFKINIGTLKEIKGGDKSFEGDCGVIKGVKAVHLPVCIKENEKINYFDGKENREIMISILAASNQKGEIAK